MPAGRNLLLNVPVNRDGLIHPNDSTRLMEFKKAIDVSFKTDLAKGKKVVTSEVRGIAKQFAARNLTDGDANTYWTTNDGVTTATITIDLGKQTELNRVVLQEHIALGQRVKSFSIACWDGKAFKQIDQQTTIGYKRIIPFQTISTSKIQIQILASNACPVLSGIQLYRAPEEF